MLFLLNEQWHKKEKNENFILFVKIFTENRENGDVIQHDTHIEYKIIYALNLNLFYTETLPHKAYIAFFYKGSDIGLVTCSIV